MKQVLPVRWKEKKTRIFNIKFFLLLIERMWVELTWRKDRVGMAWSWYICWVSWPRSWVVILKACQASTTGPFVAIQSFISAFLKSKLWWLLSWSFFHGFSLWAMLMIGFFYVVFLGQMWSLEPLHRG